MSRVSPPPALAAEIQPIVVLKFGSSVLRTPADLPALVQEVYLHLRAGERVVAVVSALAGETDGLLAAAHSAGDDRSPAGEQATATLCATGEVRAAALLTHALLHHGVPARLTLPEHLALRTRGTALDAVPVAGSAGLDRERALQLLAQFPVLVVPGFYGHDEHGLVQLLGRGGSDLSALTLAARLGARCRLLKDVDGLYERDPALPGPIPARYRTLGYESALLVAGKLVQPKTLQAARDQGVVLEVAAIGRGDGSGTLIGPYVAVSAPSAPVRRLRVVLLGLGVVGRGVYDLLQRDPQRFEVVRVLVQHPARHAAQGVPAALLTTDPLAALTTPADVVVEALGGPAPAALVAEALRLGRTVVSANKVALTALHATPDAPATARLAAAPSAERHLRTSAAVGGAVPVLETLARLRHAEEPIVAVRGVLNGTCNFVLDRLAAGLDYTTAVAEAQAAGFAEPDPSYDVDGRDAACKLDLCAAALGWRVGPRNVQGITRVTRGAVAEATLRGESLRLVANLAMGPDGLARLTVGVQSLPAEGFIAGARAEENRVEIELADGRVLRLSGKGAGRAPTALAVVADLLDAAHAAERQAQAAA